MKTILVILIVAVLAFAPSAYAAGVGGPYGPAPNSGDGISDGSGFDDLLP